MLSLESDTITLKKHRVNVTLVSCYLKRPKRALSPLDTYIYMNRYIHIYEYRQVYVYLVWVHIYKYLVTHIKFSTFLSTQALNLSYFYSSLIWGDLWRNAEHLLKQHVKPGNRMPHIKWLQVSVALCVICFQYWKDWIIFPFPNHYLGVSQREVSCLTFCSL